MNDVMAGRRNAGRMLLEQFGLLTLRSGVKPSRDTADSTAIVQRRRGKTSVQRCAKSR